MNRMLSRAVPFLLALAVCSSPAHGQDAGTEGADTAVIYTLQDLSGSATTHDFEQTITDAITAEFEASGAFRLVSQADWEAAARSRSLTVRDLLGGPAASELARSLKADLAVSGTYSVVDLEGLEQILVSLQCWDARDARLLAGVQKTSRFDLAFYLALRGWVAGLLPAIRLPAQAGPVPVTPSKPLLRDITFVSAEEGMEVLIAGDASAGVITGGELVFPLGAMAEGTLLRVTKRKAGYHDAVQTLKAARQVTLTPLVKKSSFAADVEWTVGEILGAGSSLRWYPVPDALFASFGVYLFAQPPVTPAPRAVIHGDASVSFGGYLFFPPDAPVRLSLETGAGVVLSAFTQPGFPLYTDFYLDVASVTVETRVLGPPIFLRIDSRYALGIGTNLVGRGWPRDGLPFATIGVLFRW